MKPHSEKNGHSERAGRTAADWVLRHDRGLSALEQDEFSQWLAAAPDHRSAWAEHRWGWDEFDRLAGLQTSLHAVPDPDLLAPKESRGTSFPHFRTFSVSLAAAAVVALGFFLWQRPVVPPPKSSPETAPSLALIERRELADGSVVELNRGAVVIDRFTAGERRVGLVRGEAHFNVAKDESRPFVVEAAGVAVRAVGTAFNVRLDSATVEVLVTEGKVAVLPADPGQTAVSGTRTLGSGPQATRDGPRTEEDRVSLAGVTSLPSARLRSPTAGTLVAAGERTVVSLSSAAPACEVSALSSAEIEARLAWQPRLLDFTGARLVEIVAEFNRRNPVRLVLGDPSLAKLRLSATFRSDNVEGFVRLMTSDFGMRAERHGEDQIILVLAGQRPN